MTMNQLAVGAYPIAPPVGDPKTALTTMSAYVEPAPRRDMAQQWDKLDELMKWLRLRWEPPNSPARMVLVKIARIVLSCWLWVGISVLFATLIALLVPRYRWAAGLGVFWVGYGVIHALVGVAGERYMAIAEPLSYILVVSLAGGFLLNRPVIPGRA